MEPTMVHDMKETAAISPLAGRTAPPSLLVDLIRLEREYYERQPDLEDPTQLVSFGTSGHRGSPFRGSFTEAHIAAITQAICDYRRGQRIDGPLYMGKDTHALSSPAQCTALEVLAANDVETVLQRDEVPQSRLVTAGVLPIRLSRLRPMRSAQVSRTAGQIKATVAIWWNGPPRCWALRLRS
jgi:hypothetical protein